MTLVCFALPFESGKLRKNLGSRAARPFRVIHTGMGVEAAGEAVRNAISAQRPDWILASGFCGALDPALPVGSVVIGSNVSSPERLGIATKWIPGGHVGTIATQPAVIASASEKYKLHQETGAAAVDMESERIFAIAREFEIPMLTVRIVSDDARSDLIVPAAILSAAAEGGPTGILRLASWLLASPDKWLGFARFVSDSRTAQNAVSTAILPIIR